MADGDRTAQPTVVSRRWFCEVRGTRALHGSLRRGKFLASNGLCGMGTGARGPSSRHGSTPPNARVASGTDPAVDLSLKQPAAGVAPREAS